MSKTLGKSKLEQDSNVAKELYDLLKRKSLAESTTPKASYDSDALFQEHDLTKILTYFNRIKKISGM